MDETKIRHLVQALDTKSSLEEEKVWEELRPLGEAIAPYLLEFYPHAKKWQGRVSCVYHCIRYARVNEHAFQLGVKALTDRATVVRYRACSLVAYSLRDEAIAYLRPLLTHNDKRTSEDAAAAIDAITQQNHHLFYDRDHTGGSRWVVTQEDEA